MLARAGYRNIKIQEMHKDSRGSSTGYESTYSFFANGTDGDNTIIKWNGFYFITGIYLSFDSKEPGKQKNSIGK